MGSWVAGLRTCYPQAFSIHSIDAYFSRRRYRIRPRSPLASSASAPGVSILRPLKGLDTNLYENLESTFQQEYPNFEIIFSVAEMNDQALPIVRDLISKYPHTKAKIIIGDSVSNQRWEMLLSTLARGGGCRHKPQSQQPDSFLSASLQ